MTEQDSQIVKLTRQGLSARKVAERLGIQHGSVSRVARKYVGPQPKGNNSTENAIVSLRPYVVECLRRRGLNPYHCDICDEWKTRRLDIHHKKYACATVYDLCYACRSCQTSRVNKGLA